MKQHTRPSQHGWHQGWTFTGLSLESHGAKHTQHPQRHARESGALAISSRRPHAPSSHDTAPVKKTQHKPAGKKPGAGSAKLHPFHVAPAPLALSKNRRRAHKTQLANVSHPAVCVLTLPHLPGKKKPMRVDVCIHKGFK